MSRHFTGAAVPAMRLKEVDLALIGMRLIGTRMYHGKEEYTREYPRE